MLSPTSSGLFSDLLYDVPMNDVDNSMYTDMQHLESITSILATISKRTSNNWLRNWADTKASEIEFIMSTLNNTTDLDAESLMLLEELFPLDTTPATPATPAAAPQLSTMEIRDTLLTKMMYTACDPTTDDTTRNKASELTGLLQRWKDMTFNLVGKETKSTGVKVESKYRNFFYHTPRELILWVLDNPTHTPAELYTCITATAYDYDTYGDDQHMYLACSLKKLMDMVSMEYSIPLGDMYQKFGRASFLSCFVTTKKGKCSNACYSHVFCNKHRHIASTPYDAFQKWKAVST